MKAARPTKAFILAAGFGTRMLPLSRSLPKPLMPLWGRPLLAHTLGLLKAWGVRDVLINAHHRANDILQFVLAHEAQGLRLQLSYEPEILGTGGALRKAAWFLDENPFWLINSDIAADLDPEALLRCHRRHHPLAALWLDPERGPRTVEMRRGRIISFRRNPSDRSDQSDLSDHLFTFCGLHLLSPRILRYLPEQEVFAGIITAYEKAIRAGERVLACCIPDSYWADVGSPEQYLESHREILARRRAGLRGGSLADPGTVGRAKVLARHGVTLHGFAAVAHDAHLARGAVLEDAVIWNGVRVHPAGAARHAVIGPAAEVFRPVTHVALRAGDALEPHEIEALARRGWNPDRCTVEVFSARGSARTFYRVHAPDRTMILVRYSREREENALYAGQARFLQSLGFPVPRILAHDPDRQTLLMEDLGTISLSDICEHGSRREVRAHYRRVLDQVARLHGRGAEQAARRRLRLMKPFSRALYRWEHEYFITHFLKGYLDLRAGEVRGIRQDLERVARRLGRAPRVLIHRDLQSSNILVRRGRPFFVDFQGMRLGPAAYDLASLLCDPYVMLPERVQVELLRYYARRARDANAEALFWWAAVQRLAQALGAYARLGRLPGAARFLSHIPPALIMLDRALAHTAPLPHLQNLVHSRLPPIRRGTR
ncbi:MAG: phosphotransferase [Kiritimatiellae bacterium]|nr:phosphotransferase [Kiritimatiellia bacterium]